MKQQERNKSHHLSCVFLRIFLLDKSFAAEGSSAQLYLLNSPDATKMTGRKLPPFVLFNLIFHSQTGHRRSGESLLAQCRGSENKNMFACLVFFFVPPSSDHTRGTGVATLKTWRRRGSDSRSWLCSGRICWCEPNESHAHGPLDGSLPVRRVLKHTVIAFGVIWQRQISWLQGLFIDKVILHYSANLKIRGEKMGGYTL